MMAHSHFATTDMASTFGFLLGCISIAWYVEKPGLGRAVALSMALAVAQTLKLPNILLYPAAVFVVLLYEWRSAATAGARVDFLALVKRHALAFLIILPLGYILVLQGAYGFIDRASFGAMIATSPHKDLLEHYARGWFRLRPVIPALYSYTIAYAKFFNAQGNWTFLAGHYSQFGWWYYYPVAMLLKTPIPVLAAGVAGLVLWVRRPVQNWALVPLMVPAALYLLYFCVMVHGNVGVRHVLPIYPAMFALGGLAMARLYQRLSSARRYVLPAFAGAWLVVISAVTFPHYEEYFNLLAGGSNNGWKWLGDSNIDFGQEQFYEENWARKQKGPVSIDPLKPVTGKLIIRATLLIGHTREMTSETAWLRDHYKPMKQPTPALLVFDVPTTVPQGSAAFK
jgi:hypothetical protein